MHSSVSTYLDVTQAFQAQSIRRLELPPTRVAAAQVLVAIADGHASAKNIAAITGMRPTEVGSCLVWLQAAELVEDGSGPFKLTAVAQAELNRN